ncbi:Nn.00g069430.m01.CDS01 [Neocucurbitaria sp. VM-36]
MPAKRRKASELASAPQPKKRITRSSTKADASAVHAPIPSDLTIEHKPLKAKRNSQAKSTTTAPKAITTASTSNSAKPKVKASAKADTTKKTTASEPSTTASNITPFTINSPAIKTPIQCHAYKSPNPHLTSYRTLIFTHGAGGTLSAPAVVNFCTGYARLLPVRAFQGSMNLASRVKGFHACLEDLRDSEEKGKGNSVVLGGRSMGARAAVIAASELLSGEEEGEAESKEERVQLVLVSYPLKGPKDDVRDEILLSLPGSVEVLFVIGDRDAMCPLDLLKSVRAKMKAKSQLVVVKGADHGMHVRPAKRETQVGEETGRVAATWVEGKMGEDVVYVGEEEE